MANAQSEPADDRLRWVTSFTAEHGRSPSVLHFGNVANNGYNNAKLLVDAGLDCDVLCADYYHIMACPEWEDADIEGTVADQFHPDWSSVDLQGFSRPPWFAQGPLDICLLYLIARKRQRRVVAGALWRMLLATCHLRPAGSTFAAKRLRFVWFTLSYLIWTICRFARYEPSFDVRGKYHRYTEGARHAGDRLLAVCRVALVMVVGLALLPLWLANLAVAGIVTALAIGKIPRWYFRTAMAPAKSIVRAVARLWGVGTANGSESPDDLAVSFEEAFPDRPDQLQASDIDVYAPVLPLFKELFSCYDIVEAYATCPIYPLLAGKRPYIAYEHGTIRDIPFEATPAGRTTAISYRLADYSFVTNPDCIEAARKLQLKEFCYVPHVIDRKYHQEVPATARKPIVFCPARHDWRDKGSDQVIRGFAEFAREADEFRLVMTNWGQDLDRSRQLIDELGIADRVQLIEPLPVIKMIRLIGESRILVDQFSGNCGGIAPAALSVGTPLVIHLDLSKYEWCWTQPPPYYDATDAGEICQALHAALTCNMDELRDKARIWVQENYWYKQVVREHLRVYDHLLRRD